MCGVPQRATEKLRSLLAERGASAIQTRLALSNEVHYNILFLLPDQYVSLTDDLRAKPASTSLRFHVRTTPGFARLGLQTPPSPSCLSLSTGLHQSILLGKA